MKQDVHLYIICGKQVLEANQVSLIKRQEKLNVVDALLLHNVQLWEETIYLDNYFFKCSVRKVGKFLTQYICMLKTHSHKTTKQILQDYIHIISTDIKQVKDSSYGEDGKGNGN